MLYNLCNDKYNAMLLAGIGEVFTRSKRKWMIIDIREGNYKCQTIDKGELIIKNFTKNDMYKIFGTT